MARDSKLSGFYSPPFRRHTAKAQIVASLSSLAEPRLQVAFIITSCWLHSLSMISPLFDMPDNWQLDCPDRRCSSTAPPETRQSIANSRLLGKRAEGRSMTVGKSPCWLFCKSEETYSMIKSLGPAWVRVFFF